MSAAAFTSLRERPRRSLSGEAGAGADEGTLLTATLQPPQSACRAADQLWAWTHFEAWGKTRLGQELNNRTPAGGQEGLALIDQIPEALRAAQEAEKGTFSFLTLKERIWGEETWGKLQTLA